MHTSVGDVDGRTEISEARTADHGDAVDPWQRLYPRDSGGVSRKRPTGLHDDPDHGLSPGSQEGGAPHQEGGELSHLRSRGLARCRAAEVDPRSPSAVRRSPATCDGAPDRVRSIHAGGCIASRENSLIAGEKAMAEMTPAP